ncbi:MAG TPA: hypothetical protein VHK88_02540, partial [Aquihabitans sp.]|nr:hypothetical protein [Aquihabitans sp.]
MQRVVKVRRGVVAAAMAVMLAVATTGCQPTLTGVEFKVLYDRLEPLPGSVKLTTPPSITGDRAADDRIGFLALARGYRLRSRHTG